jgi:hypothetical protein
MHFHQLGLPGTRSANFATPREIFWGGDASRMKIMRLQGQFSNTIRDAGETPTTSIRPGLLVGALTADSKLVHWDPAATDGSQWLRGVCEHELTATEGFGATAAESFAPYVVQAPLKASSLLVLGTALTSSAHQYLARRLLARLGCTLDDDPQGYLAGVNARTILKTETGSITAAENGADFHVVGAGAVTLTLPTLATGLRYRFINGADQNLIVASAGSLDNIVTINDVAADSITFSTSSQKIGATVDIWADYLNGTLKWFSQVQIGTATIA